MPPDADKTRQQQQQQQQQQHVQGHVGREEEFLSNTTAVTASTTIRSLNTLQAHEVAIDGIVYDLRTFDHPGGESIFMFGGNDATTQYRMIHPYHTEKHLTKLTAIGTIPDYVSEYKFDTPFEKEMKQEVFKIVRRGREFGTVGFFSRSIFYCLLFFYLQYLWVVGPTSYSLAIVYGVSMALIGLNVQHDANHGAASRTRWVNDVLGLGADFIGGSKWLWMEKHWTHHAFTNHKTRDPDGFSAEPFLLFNDYELGNLKRTSMHAYQAFYFVLILSGYWISSVFNVHEVLDLQDRGALNVGVKLQDNPWIASRVKFAFPLRLLYLVTNVVAPLIRSGCTWTTVAHINVMGIAGSLALGLLFTLSHNFEQAERDPIGTAVALAKKKEGSGATDSKDTNNNDNDSDSRACWFRAQVETSSTYGGFISGYLTGGLNFQVEHHLFPRMCSAWYPYIAPTVRRVCAKHNVRYVYYPWIWQNMISTLRYTHAVGNASHWKNHNPLKGEL